MYIRNKLFYIHIENPFKTWWKVRKVFKFIFPKIRVWFNIKGFPFIHHVGKIFYLDIHDIYWKDKFNSPRHEVSPELNFTLFNIFNFRIHMELNDDYIYWETLLDYLYYGFNVEEAIKHNTWETFETKIKKDASKYIKKNVDRSKRKNS